MMSTAIGTFQQDFLSNRRLSWVAWRRQYAWLSVLIFFVLFSALALIYVKNLNRGLISQIQSTEQDIGGSHVRWSQLLLEESALESRTRVAHIAKTQLHMKIPATRQMIYVTTEHSN